ncbi:hypothetical protein [Mesobacillus subterraneus]|uniref:Uncharacterized protein n=1 Tax=Mesobacillus subterraneus TaxID=285983 RepID=A0A3R9EZQ5_9BACI|nr:hypothetical protein [Mesobacillus subterraneus]RSD26830.1 hypothetical protein EJA10_13325 [Mesobacillus subterraneus]
MSGTQMDHDVKEYLDSYKVDFPNEDELEASIEFIMAKVPVRETRSEVIKRKANSLMLNSVRELLNFGWAFWTLNGAFLLLGMISLIQWSDEPYTMIFMLAPLPFIVGIFEIMKSRDKGMIELELTLKYNAQQILTSRLFVVGLYNLLMNAGLSAVLLTVNPEIQIARLFLSWTVPYVLVTGIAFLLALKTKGIPASATFIALWIAVSAAGFRLPGLSEMFIKIGVLPAAGLIFAGVLVWVINIASIRKMGIGGEKYES